jgi:ankyrin repeat protein
VVAKYGETPLHEACSRGHTEIVKALIDNNADVNTTDADGDSHALFDEFFNNIYMTY